MIHLLLVQPVIKQGSNKNEDVFQFHTQGDCMAAVAIFAASMAITISSSVEITYTSILDSSVLILCSLRPDGTF